MRLAIDADGVLRDFVGKLEQVYDREVLRTGFKGFPYTVEWRQPVTKYGIHEFFSIGNNIYDFAFREHAKEIFLEAKPYPGAMEFMDKLFRDHTIIIATAQSNTSLIMYTTEWLDLHSIPYHEFYATLNGVKNVQADLLLDDCTKNLIDFDENEIEFGKPISYPICMDRPWNQDWKGYRVHSFEDFLEYVK